MVIMSQEARKSANEFIEEDICGMFIKEYNLLLGAKGECQI